MMLSELEGARDPNHGVQASGEIVYCWWIKMGKCI